MLIIDEKKQIELRFGGAGDTLLQGTVSVDRDADDFEHDDGIFDPELAKTAAALAMSASDQTALSENLEALGYRTPAFVAYDHHEENRIGVGLGFKERTDSATIAVVLRETVGREWYSNFDIGYGCEHAGFRKAAEFAEQRLSDYLYVRAQKRQLRFLVTGYSRGGAAANILAKRLCDRYGLDAVRAYTFASPNTGITVRGARYSTVYNLVRDEDFFTRAPLSGWGYTKYGQTISLSGCGRFEKRYRLISGEDYIGFDTPEQTDRFLCAVMRLAPNVHAYYERRYPVGKRMLSLYDYMLAVASMLAEETDDDNTDILMSAMVSQFAELSDFLSSGMDIGTLLSSAQGIPRCSIADTHSPAAYIAALDAYLN